jgi:SWI/SNF-related matrix-associated actin-dependent regulator 1 of chromatin subfamily A
MNQHETPDVAADAAFERALLASARGDELPTEAAHDAWLRFSAATGALAAAATLAPVPSQRFWARPKFRWLTTGAAAGAALTAALFGWPWAAPTRATQSRNAASPAAVSLTAPAPSAAATAAKSGSSAGFTAARPQPAPLLPVARSATPTAKRHRAAAGAASTLAAEIAALDGVRRAMAAGQFDRAYQGTQAYAREFPRGQLAADAEALAAEALAGRGERAAASERAARFLERYPEDPHAARMRRLIDH